MWKYAVTETKSCENESVGKNVIFLESHVKVDE